MRTVTARRPAGGTATPTGPDRVCLTSAYALPHVRRGTETLVHGLATWLQGEGVDAAVVTAGPARRDYGHDGVRYLRVAAPDLSRHHWDLEPDVTLVAAMAARLAVLRPPLVHSFLYPDAAAARLARRPYVVTYGGIALADRFRAHRVRWKLFHLATRGARRVICPSRAAASHLWNEYGYQAEVIPNAVDVARYASRAPTEAGLVFCASTPDDRRKRVEVLVDAFDRVAGQRADVRLVLAGAASPETRRALLDRLRDPHRSRVQFVGDLGADELAGWYARASLVCLPSLNEAFGMVLVEAMAAGTPVVGARHGAIPEVIDDSVGATFEPDDAAACASALLGVMDMAAQPAVGQACLARAANYDWSAVGPRLLAVYREVT